MSDDDTFKDIIKLNNLDGLMKEEENLTVTNVKEIHEGISLLNETAMYLTEFVIQFLSALGDGLPAAELPNLTVDMVVAMRESFAGAEKLVELMSEMITSEDGDNDD